MVSADMPTNLRRLRGLRLGLAAAWTSYSLEHTAKADSSTLWPVPVRMP